MSASIEPASVTKLFARRYEGKNAHVPFLAPWWGAPPEDPSSLHSGQFANWAASRPAEYELVSDPKQADAFVLSIPWKLTRGSGAVEAFAKEQIREAKKHGKRIIIFFDSDHDDAIEWPRHAIVFRFSIYSDTCGANQFSIPTFSQDFLALNYGGRLELREKSAVPSVGFCGYAPPVGCRLSKHSLREVGRYVAYRAGVLKSRRQLIAHAPRVQALRALQRTKGVDTRFIVRDQFAFNRWGVLQPGGTPETAAKQRHEFIENLNTTDYALCVRGLANCSIRFYEAISLGRIPVFVNTQCVLPYDWLVDWKAACVWVEEKDLGRIGPFLRHYHAQLTPEEFAAKQRLARELFQKWICPEGFFRELHRHLALVDQRTSSVSTTPFTKSMAPFSE
ncbi:MAG TPA: exostosin family protein [Opitutaceae bacterium]|nr:exostosin family protein [Opitutaceae bacterium]